MIWFGGTFQNLAKMVLQMDDVSRVQFKIKFSTFFGRLTEEELAAGLADAWNVTPAAYEPPPALAGGDG